MFFIFVFIRNDAFMKKCKRLFYKNSIEMLKYKFLIPLNDVACFLWKCIQLCLHVTDSPYWTEFFFGNKELLNFRNIVLVADIICLLLSIPFVMDTVEI